MNDKEKELQFLQIVRVNGNLYHLTLSGWTYRDVLGMLNRFVKLGLVAVREGETLLTQDGNEYYKRMYKSLHKKGVSRFLAPALNYKSNQLSKEAVYIPTSFRANEEF